MIESNAQILLHMLQRTDTIRFPLQSVLLRWGDFSSWWRCK